MSQDTNLQIINVEDDFDQRVQDYFTNYFQLPFKLNPGEYDTAKAFFLKRTNNNVDAAAALTAACIDSANNLKVFLIDIINEFEKTTDLKAALPLYLNSSRRGSSILGYVNSDRGTSANILRQVNA
jgi:hypothetical protein